MSVPTWTSQPLSSAARSNGVYSDFMTTSPTKQLGAMRDTSKGSGSSSFMPTGVALTTMSKPSGSFEPVRTTNAG